MCAILDSLQLCLPFEKMVLYFKPVIPFLASSVTLKKRFLQHTTTKKRAFDIFKHHSHGFLPF